jgi:hypothetical protein
VLVDKRQLLIERKGERIKVGDALNKSTHQGDDTSPLDEAQDGEIMGSFGSATNPAGPWHRGELDPRSRATEATTW